MWLSTANDFFAISQFIVVVVVIVFAFLVFYKPK